MSCLFESEWTTSASTMTPIIHGSSQLGKMASIAIRQQSYYRLVLGYFAALVVNARSPISGSCDTRLRIERQHLVMGSLQARHHHGADPLQKLVT